jgi:hypothetical protein
MEEKHGHYLRANKPNTRKFPGRDQNGKFETDHVGSVFAKIWREWVPVDREKINELRDMQKKLQREERLKRKLNRKNQKARKGKNGAATSKRKVV